MIFRAESYRILAHPLLVLAPGLAFLAVLTNAVSYFFDLEAIPFAVAVMGVAGLVVESSLRAIRRAQARRAGTQNRLREVAILVAAGYLLGSVGRLLGVVDPGAAVGPLETLYPAVENVFPTVTALVAWFVAFGINGRLLYHDRFLSLTQGVTGNDLYLVIRNNADIGRAFYFTMKTLRAIYFWLAFAAVGVHLLAHAISGFTELSSAPPGHFAAIVLVLVTVGARATVRIIAEKGYTESLGVSVSRRLESRRIIVAILGVLLLALPALILAPSRPIVPSTWLDAFFSWLAALFTSEGGEAVEQAPTFADFERMRAYLNELSAYRDISGPPDWVRTLAVVLRTVLIIGAGATFVGFLVYPLFTRRRRQSYRGVLKRRILTGWYEFLRFFRRLLLFLRLLRRRLSSGSQASGAGRPTRSASSPAGFDRKRRRQGRRLDRLFTELVTAAKKAHVPYGPTDSLSDFVQRAAEKAVGVEPEPLLTLFYRGRYGPSELTRAEMHTLVTEVKAFAGAMAS